MLKILQARLQQYVNCELLDVQAGFRKGRGTRDQTANICWIIKKAKEFQKNIYFHFIPLPELISSVTLLNIAYVLSTLWALWREPQAKPSPFLQALIRAMMQKQDTGG